MDIGRVARISGRCVGALASAAVLVGAGLAWGLQQHVSATLVTSNVVKAPPVRPGRAFTALLVGLDARTDANGNPLPRALLDALHAGPDAGQLHTDTIILLHVPAEPGQPAAAISIPRDSYVVLADGSGKHKINAAYARASTATEKDLTKQGIVGAELDRRGREAGRAALVATVEDLTGVSVDHYAEINLAGFVELTDALGGVPVCLNAPEHDSYSGLDLPAGLQFVSGPAALAFVRQRHGLEGGDLDRIQRQQAFIAGLARRLQAAGALTNPVKLDQLLAVATRHVVVDKGWDLQQAVGQIGRLSGDDLTFRTIPTGRTDLRTPGDGMAVAVDPAAVRAFVAEEFDDASATPAAAPTTAPTPTTASPTPTAGVRRPAAATPRAMPSPTTTRVITAGGVPCVD